MLPLPVTSSLLFACADCRALASIRRNGLSGEEIAFSDLEEARGQCDECILVIERNMGNGRSATSSTAIRNLEPYLDPVPVTAAGGFVVREMEGQVEIVLILRRGMWDLPKGKLDKGESVEECAAREVSEELGIGEVIIGHPLGRTVHGYNDGTEYAVKTTHWFSMTTKACDFQPEEKEKIERAEWVRLSEARERLSFDTLRRHVDAVEHLL